MSNRTDHNIDEKLFVKYLSLLCIQKQKPSLGALTKITNAHISKVPFENISKLFYKRKINLTQLIDFDLYLEGIEKYGFGGTCYSNNYYLYLLLSWLGFDVKLCGADMKIPDVHIVIIVSLNKKEYIVDAGYAAPFSMPVPLDLNEDFTIISGRDRYVLKPKDKFNRSRLELYRNSTLIHGYYVNPVARDIGEFRKVIADSFSETATFMNTLLITRIVSDHFITISNMTCNESFGTLMKTYSLDSFDNLVSVIEKHFSIPKPISKECLSEFRMQGDAWN